MPNVKDILQKYNLKDIEDKKSELETKLSNPQSNIDHGQVSAQLSYTTDLFEKVSDLFKMIDEYKQAVEIQKQEENSELKEMAQSDIDDFEPKITQLDEEITDMEIQHQFEDPDDLKSVIMEIRAGAGGDEAAIFAGDLFRMYSQFAGSKGWSVEIVSSNVTDSGYKEVIAYISGKDVYKFLKYESGVHRVQRIPVTESSGRIHTSTASVAVLPEAKDIDVEVKPEDIEIEVMRATGAGGQCVNKTDSAVRITHLPTQIIVSCQETKHQAQNKEKAMTMLRTRLYEHKKEEENAKRADMRSSQIGSAMRAEKIRTYNYPQSRVTDHRVKESWHNLEEILDGKLEEVIETVTKEIQQQQLTEIKQQKKKEQKRRK